MEHILTQAYAVAVKDSSSLNKYKGFSDQVYGEAGSEMISELIRKIPIGQNDVFLDLGSGIGQVTSLPLHVLPIPGYGAMSEG